MAQSTYTLFTRSSGASTSTVSKVELVTSTTSGVTTGDTLSIDIQWTYTGTPVATSTTDILNTICCVESLDSSTDPLAAFLKDKCFGASMKSTAASPFTVVAASKLLLRQGIKSGTNFIPGAFINSFGYTGNDITVASPVLKTGTQSLNIGQLAAIGLLTTAPTKVNFKCGHKDWSNTAANELTASNSIAIEQTNTGTFTLSGTGSTACKTSSSTSSSSATFEGIIPMAFLASILALLALF